MFRKIFQTLFRSRSQRMAMKNIERMPVPPMTEAKEVSPYPAQFFTPERITSIEGSLGRLSTVEDPKVTLLE